MAMSKLPPGARALKSQAFPSEFGHSDAWMGLDSQGIEARGELCSGKRPSDPGGRRGGSLTRSSTSSKRPPSLSQGAGPNPHPLTSLGPWSSGMPGGTPGRTSRANRRVALGRSMRMRRGKETRLGRRRGNAVPPCLPENGQPRGALRSRDPRRGGVKDRGPLHPGRRWLPRGPLPDFFTSATKPPRSKA
jgi:hypothetical protein